MRASLSIAWCNGKTFTIGLSLTSLVHLALVQKDLPVTQRLLSLGADPNALSKKPAENISPLKLSIEARDYSATRTLLNYGADTEDQLYKIIEKGGVDAKAFAELLLEFGADPNPSMAPWLDNPLSLAIWSGQEGIAQSLLSHGANPRAKGNSGQSPLHLAVAMKSHALTRAILKKGADPNAAFQKPPTPAFLELVKTEGVGRWALRETHRVTPLMLAADMGDASLAQILLSNGASRDYLTRFRGTKMFALSFASRRHDTNMMRTLLGLYKIPVERRIKVDLSEKRAWVYDADGKNIFSTRISAGKRSNPTLPGRYVITNKYPHWTSTIYNAKMPWFQRFSGSDIGFHQGYVPGYHASHGCLRVSSGRAKKLYQITQIGDPVEIVP